MFPVFITAGRSLFSNCRNQTEKTVWVIGKCLKIKKNLRDTQTIIPVKNVKDKIAKNKLKGSYAIYIQIQKK